MNLTVGREDIEAFKERVTEQFGLAFDPTKQDQLARVLLDRLQERGLPSVEAYLALISAPESSREEFRALAEQLTVAETYFHRHPDQFRAFADVALVQCRRGAGGMRKLRILSAGCSSGEEPYTLAMLACETLGEGAAEQVEILGININGALLAKAREGRYSEWSLRGTPDELRRRYFRQEGRSFQLEGTLLQMVAFEERNLAAEDPDYWRPGAFDVIFCRNVLMYFTAAAMGKVVERFAKALAPGGFLFLGPAETLRGLTQAFHLRHSHETFYYQRRRADEPASGPSMWGHTAAGPTGTGSVPESPVRSEPLWPQEIARASARILALSEEARIRPEAPRSEDGPPSQDGASGLALAMEHYRRERFEDAVHVLRSLPSGAGEAVEALLLLAVVLAQKGDYGEAQAVCTRVLVSDELNAGAHYLAALCREQAGDAVGAGEHDQAAVYLDPTFAMPHLHLGLLARKEGRLGAARREWNQALDLLAREDTARILLFGGGFSREALMNLCRTAGGEA